MQIGPTVIVDTTFIERKYIAPPNIVEGGVLGYEALTLLTGQEGIGKSLLVMQLAYHIASGVTWLGHAILQPQPVLLIQKELPDADLQGRYRTQLAGRPATGRLYIVETPFGVQFMGGALYPGYLNDWIRAEKPRVIIIDPLIEFHSADENRANEIAMSVLRVVEGWKAQGISTILVHHHGKPNEENPRSGTSRIRGSSALAGSADTNLQLIEISRDQGWYQLEFAKLRRHAPRHPIALVRDAKTLTYQLRGAHIAIYDALRQMGGVVDQSDLISWAVTNQVCSKTTAYDTIMRLVSEGKLTRIPGAPKPGGGRFPDKIRLPIRKSEEPLVAAI